MIRIANNSNAYCLVLFCLVIFFLVTCGLGAGCAVPPQGTVSDVRTLGSVLDEINQQQEAIAEAAKFVIYMHEFEINAPPIFDEFTPSRSQPNEVYGFRLNAAGRDHVRQIAHRLVGMLETTGVIPTQKVTVERSNTSKKSNTVHQFPVHLNVELDEMRRHMVIAALSRLGVPNAESIVVVAPAFATGLNAEEAAAAYRRSTSVANTQSR